MKYLLTVSLIAFGFVSADSAHAYGPTHVNITPQAVFVPNGFDDNDQTTVVVDGYLPDTCYRLDSPLIVKDFANGRIVVQPRAQVFPGVCMTVIVPFTTTVNLGTVPFGDYRLEDQKGHVMEHVRVKRAILPGPDDYLYAPVDVAHVRLDSSGKWIATIQGRFTNTCLSIQEMRVINSGKTIELLPIMQSTGGSSCKNMEFPYEKSVELPKLPAGRHLLHVRSLNGQAVNEVFTVAVSE